MALTTTDFFTQKGKLLTNPNGYKVVTEKLDDPASEMAALVGAVKGSSTSFWEQGLESSRQALSKEGKLFLKDGQPLAVIYVSDEDDYSCADECTGAQPEDNPKWKAFPIDRYTSFLKALKTSRKIDVRVYPIVGILEGSCNVASYGIRYLKVRSQVGGRAGSVCRAEFEESLMAITDDMTAGSPTVEPPTVLANPINFFDAMEDVAFTANLAAFVSGSGTLTFSKVSGPAWMVVSADGTLHGTPTAKNVGANSARVKVCNEKASCAEMTVNVEVLHVNHPPVWKQNPIELGTARENQLFTFNLDAFVYDPDVGVITCQATSLPTWLTLTASCALAGRPERQDVGKFNAKIRAVDSQGMFAEVTVNGEVVKK